MPEKGKTNNPNGRPAGIPNKATVQFKEALNNLLDQAAPDMVLWLNEIDDPFKRFDVLSKFAEYIHPKLGRTESDITHKGQLTVNIVKLSDNPASGQ